MEKNFSKILVPKHIEYLIVNQNLTIVTYSEGVTRCFEFSEELTTEVDVREAFPELYGYEDILIAVMNGEQENYDLKAINRSLSLDKQLYLDLYCSQYQDEIREERYLIIFVEDVTDKMSLEQTLVQSNNEAALLFQALESSKKYTDNIK